MSVVVCICSTKATPQARRSPWWGHTRSTGTSSGLSCTGDMDTLEAAWQRTTNIDLDITVLTKGLERLTEQALLSLEKRRLRYINISKEGAKRTESVWFQCCSVTGPEVLGTDWNLRFPLNNRKHFFTLSVIRQWHRAVHREAVESPSLEIFETTWTGSWTTSRPQVLTNINHSVIL